MTLVIFVLGTAGLILAFSRIAARETSEVFPQNQNGQPEALALRIRFPYRRQGSRYVPDPKPQTRAITNCRRIGFQFFLKTLEVTPLHFALRAGEISKRLYGLNGDGEEDLIVHVNHVQPASSILDPTIETNLLLSSFAHKLRQDAASSMAAESPWKALIWIGSGPMTPCSPSMEGASTGSSS